MVNRGWLRIVEASIAILIIFSVLLIINSRNNFSEEQDLARLIPPLLEEIARNVTLRENIVNTGTASQPELIAFIDTRIKQANIRYDVVVCEINQLCSLPVYPSEAANIYASERVISSTIDNYDPKKVKIFLWRSQT